MVMLWKLALASCLASEVLAWSVLHHYENMAFFNFPVNASLIQPHLHPSLELDLDGDGMAWVSIVSSELTVQVPVIGPLTPHEIQVRTYVTGPNPVSKQLVKGCWFFDVFVDRLEVLWASAFLVNDSIPLSYTDEDKGTPPAEIAMHGTSYTLKVPEVPLPLTGEKKASLSAHSTIQDTKVQFDSDFFLDRSAWFGSTGLRGPGGMRAGALTANMLSGSKFPASPRPMEVNEFSSGVLPGFALGQPQSQHSFFIGEHDVTFKSSVKVAPSEDRHSLLV
jgi:hypothetical protein